MFRKVMIMYENIFPMEEETVVHRIDFFLEGGGVVLCTDMSGGKCRGFHEMPKTLHRISCNLVNGIALMKESLLTLPSLPPSPCW